MIISWINQRSEQSKRLNSIWIVSDGTVIPRLSTLCMDWVEFQKALVECARCITFIYIYVSVWVCIYLCLSLSFFSFIPFFFFISLLFVCTGLYVSLCASFSFFSSISLSFNISPILYLLFSLPYLISPYLLSLYYMRSLSRSCLPPSLPIVCLPSLFSVPSRPIFSLSSLVMCQCMPVYVYMYVCLFRSACGQIYLVMEEHLC